MRITTSDLKPHASGYFNSKKIAASPEVAQSQSEVPCPVLGRKNKMRHRLRQNPMIDSESSMRLISSTQ